jgi:hypothetical protein
MQHSIPIKHLAAAFSDVLILHLDWQRLITTGTAQDNEAHKK